MKQTSAAINRILQLLSLACPRGEKRFTGRKHVLTLAEREGGNKRETNDLLR
jgi:hypothetical protein